MYLIFFFFPICGHFLASELYLHLFFFPICRHSWNWKCIYFSSFSRFAVTLGTGNVSTFLLFPDLRSLPGTRIVSASLLFRGLQSLLELEMYLIFFLYRFAVTFGIGNVSTFLLFPDLRSLPGTRIVSASLLFRSLQSLLELEMYLIFFLYRFVVTFGTGNVSTFLLFPDLRSLPGTRFAYSSRSSAM